MMMQSLVRSKAALLEERARIAIRIVGPPAVRAHVAMMTLPRTRPLLRSRIASGTRSSVITRSTAGVTDPASMSARSASRSVLFGLAMNVPRRWRTKGERYP